MLDRERILSKIDDLDGYLKELSELTPASFAEYEENNQKKRACERVLQIAIEAVIDTCRLVLKGMKLGLPADEDDIFTRLESVGIISVDMVGTLRKMKGARNILVHEYGKIDNSLVFEIISHGHDDFARFRQHIVEALKG